MAIKKQIRSIFFALVCVSGLMAAQTAPSKNLAEWHKIYNRAVSSDGKWMFYTRTYDNGKSEGVLQNTKTLRHFVIDGAGKFYLDSHYFMVLNGKRELFFKDLALETQKLFADISDFEYNAALETLLLRGDMDVRWLDLKSNKEHRFSGITKTENITDTPCTFLWNATEILLLNKATGTHLPILKRSNKLLSSIADPKNRGIKLLWQDEDGLWMQTIDYYGKIISSPTKMRFDSSGDSMSFLSENTVIEKKPLVAADSKAGDTIETWSNSDKALKPKLMSMLANAQNITLHDLSEARYAPKTYRNFLTDYYLVFGDAYLMEVSDLENYDFKINDIAPRPRLRLRNRKTEEIEMEVQEVRAAYPSADLRYVLYFKDRDWYRYDVASRRTVNITALLAADFYTFDRLNSGVLYPVDAPWFSPDYHSIYFTSKNDIWKYDVDQGLMTKITGYNDKNFSFRIVAQLKGDGVSRMKWSKNSVLQNNFLILSVTDNKSVLQQGLALWKDNKLRVISTPQKQLISQVRESEHALTYLIQNANIPPKLMVYPFRTYAEKQVYDSGENIDNSNFPRTELREWTDSKGDKTYTTIVLPPGYSPEKKYPAIVRIYENEAKRYNEFEYPSFLNPAGFNRILMAMEGYIVILPRITYAKNKVGNSAVQAVEETVKKVQSWYSIDPANIGIIGHSFGGYETNYILTQSSIFKTAVSGSGIADIVADYFTVHKMYLNSNISRYTNEQFGFSDDFFSLKKEYLENSPILMADQIKTPLLLWSGNKDEHVEWRQSVEMFMALSSRKKEVRLLLFPDDAHVLVKPKNQTEATERILQWFNYYLKAGEKPKWF